MLKRLIRRSVGLAVVLLLAAQLVPYGRSHTNPPERSEPKWQNAETRALARRACFDCHSNDTVWPWYASIAPMSWLIQRDVDEGRAKVNFSRWEQPQEEAGECGKAMREGEMPPWYYAMLHPGARLEPREQRELIAGLTVITGGSADAPREHDEDE